MYLMVDGKFFPDLTDIVDNKIYWIGGKVYDSGPLVDQRLANDRDIIFDEIIVTDILDVTLKPTENDQNGLPGTAFFTIHGKDFSEGFDIRHGGVYGFKDTENGFIEFVGPGSHRWAIKKRGNTNLYSPWDGE